MSDVGRVDVTDDAINAVIEHIMVSEKFQAERFGGYDIPMKDGEIQLCLYDKSRYSLKPKPIKIWKE